MPNLRFRARVLPVAALAMLAGSACTRNPQGRTDTPDPAGAPMAASAAAPAPHPGPVPRNFLIVTLDTTRADHLGPYGYYRQTTPNLDALAEESIVFDRACSPISVTLPSHMSLFTGLHPLEHGVTANARGSDEPYQLPEELVSVPELARAAGLSNAAFVGATPVKRFTGLARGFDVFDEPRRAMRPAKATTSAALAWLQAHSQEPFFLWVHYFDPHARYLPPAPFNRMFSSDDRQEQWIRTRRMPDRIEEPWRTNHPVNVTRREINLYDGEIRYVDAQIGRLLAFLRASELWQQTAILIVSDHGEGLNQHGWPQHGGVWAEQLRIALPMRVPGRQDAFPQRVPTLTCITDVFPSLLAIAGVNWAGPCISRLPGPTSSPPTSAGVRTSRVDAHYLGAERVLTTPRWRLHLDDPKAGDLLFDCAARSPRIEQHRNRKPLGRAAAPRHGRRDHRRLPAARCPASSLAAPPLRTAQPAGAACAARAGVCRRRRRTRGRRRARRRSRARRGRGPEHGAAVTRRCAAASGPCPFPSRRSARVTPNSRHHGQQTVHESG